MAPKHDAQGELGPENLTLMSRCGHNGTPLKASRKTVTRRSRALMSGECHVSCGPSSIK